MYCYLLCRLQQKCSMVLTTKVAERDTQRQEVARLRLDQGDTSSVLETQREQLHKLTQQINAAEGQMNRVCCPTTEALQCALPHTHTHTHTHTHCSSFCGHTLTTTHMCIHTVLCTCVHTYTYMCINTHIHTHT